MIKTEKILLIVGVASLGAALIGKYMSKNSYRNFTPYTNRTICMKGSAAGENRGEFMGGRCI